MKFATILTSKALTIDTREISREHARTRVKWVGPVQCTVYIMYSQVLTRPDVQYVLDTRYNIMCFSFDRAYASFQTHLYTCIAICVLTRSGFLSLARIDQVQVLKIFAYAV